MSSDAMLHIKQTLNAEQRQSLLEHLKDRLRIAGDVHASAKPHLLFVPVDPVKASLHTVLVAVRERGYDARLVDL
jgi:hypothetical protein